MCSPQPNLHKVHWRIFPVVHILPPAWHMTKARLSAAFQRSCPIRHTCSAKYQYGWQTDNWNTWSRFTLLLDLNFNQLTPNLEILTWRHLTVSIVTKRIKHLSKTQVLGVLEGDNRLHSLSTSSPFSETGVYCQSVMVCSGIHIRISGYWVQIDILQ